MGDPPVAAVVVGVDVVGVVEIVVLGGMVLVVVGVSFLA